MKVKDLYSRPRSIAEALSVLADGTALKVCGMTDVFPAHAARPVSGRILDLSAIAELRGVTIDTSTVRIGAATSWSDIVAAPLPRAFDALKMAAREVGSLQIQNRGTIAGNLCNASPAADGVPPLLALDADVELLSPRGKRVIPLQSFITGYRKTALAEDEIVSAVVVPSPSPEARSGFVKLGSRRYLVISILMAAAVVERDGAGKIARAAVAVGAASPVAQRLGDLEGDLAGLPRSVTPSSLVKESHLAGLSPIDDIRATANYRLDAALTVVGEALDIAAGVGADG